MRPKNYLTRILKSDLNKITEGTKISCCAIPTGNGFSLIIKDSSNLNTNEAFSTQLWSHTLDGLQEYVQQLIEDLYSKYSSLDLSVPIAAILEMWLGNSNPFNIVRLHI